MQGLRPTSPRSVLRLVHLWIALGVGVLVVPIGLTGTALVVSDNLDRWIDPALYAVTGTEPAQDIGVYVGNALAAVPGAGAVRARLPAASGGPVTVLLRGGGEPSAGDALRSVALDPPTGRVLGVRDFRGTFMGLVHAFHANLLLPAFNGRSIVGWAGAGLLVLALTGLVLWCPRNAAIVLGLRWRRGPATSVNLHHMLGFWVCLPLAAMAATGMTLSFPQQARSVIGLFAETAPRPEQSGKPMVRPVQEAGTIANLALAKLDGARLVSLAFPTDPAKVWRVQLASGGEVRSVTVEDVTGTALLLPAALPGDAFAATLRRLHQAADYGPLWQAIVFVSGLAPTILLVTGLIMWRRRAKGADGLARGLREKVAFQAGMEQDAAARKKIRELARRLS